MSISQNHKITEILNVRIYKKYIYCRGLHTVIVQFVILLWRGFNHVKILDWNVDKSAGRLYINAPKVE
jgi:hypothetical protein